VGIIFTGLNLCSVSHPVLNFILGSAPKFVEELTNILDFLTLKSSILLKLTKPIVIY